MPQGVKTDRVFFVSGHGSVIGTYTPLPEHCHLYIPAPLMHSLVVSDMDMKLLTSPTEEILRWLRSGKLPIQSCKIASSQFQISRTGTPGCLYNDTEVVFDPFFEGHPNSAMKTGVYQLPMKELMATGVDTRGIQELQQDLQRRQRQYRKNPSTTTVPPLSVSKQQHLPRYTIQQKRLHNYFFYNRRYQRYTIDGEISTMSDHSQKIMAAGRAKWALFDTNTDAYSRAVRLSMTYALALPTSIFDVRRPTKSVLLSTLIAYLKQKFPASNIHVIVLSCQTLVHQWKSVPAQMKMFYQCVALSKKRRRDQTLSDYRQGFEVLLVTLYEILYKVEKEELEWTMTRLLKKWITRRPRLTQRVTRKEILEVEKEVVYIYQILKEGEQQTDKTCRLEYTFFNRACKVIEQYRDLLDRMDPSDEFRRDQSIILGFYHDFCKKKRILQSDHKMITFL